MGQHNRLLGEYRVSFHEIESAWNGGSIIQALRSALGIDGQPQVRRSSQNCGWVPLFLNDPFRRCRIQVEGTVVVFRMSIISFNDSFHRT